MPGRRHRAPCGAAAPVPWLTSQRDMQAPQGGLCGAGPVPQHPRTSAPPPPEPAAASHPFLRRWSQINYVPYVPGAHGSSLIQQHAELGDTASSACGCMRTLIRPCSCARSFGATNGGISPAATTSISGPVHLPPLLPPTPTETDFYLVNHTIIRSCSENLSPLQRAQCVGCAAQTTRQGCLATSALTWFDNADLMSCTWVRAGAAAGEDVYMLRVMARLLLTMAECCCCTNAGDVANQSLHA